MTSTFALRRAALAVSRSTRPFHSTARAFIKVGDKLPNLDVLVENSPGNKVNLSEAIKGKALLIGVPAAFSTYSQFSDLQDLSFYVQCQLGDWTLADGALGPSCSNSHIPGYINHKNLKSAGDVFVVAVNDPFVYVFVTRLQ